MSESGIFLVSIPRLSIHTGPESGVKPIYRNEIAICNTLKLYTQDLI